MIVFSIPYHSTEFAKQQKKIAGDLWIEYRLDYLKSLSDFSMELIDNKTIITIRDILEGGINFFDFQDKIQFYKKIIEKYNCLVDLEISNSCEKLNPENLILSHHNYQKFDVEELKEIIIKSNELPSKYLKIAVNIEHYSDLLRVQDLINLSTKLVIFVGMGKLGRISRFLYSHLDSIGTYISNPENQTATGQIFINEIERYKILEINKNTQIGGIIGGKQVEKSLGLEFYNNHFSENLLNAIYLPFVVENFEDFWNWLQKSKINFYGFSVTMPFKKIIASIINNDSTRKLHSVNAFLPKTNEIFNTDIIAFQKAIKYLNINNDDKILILGSGGSAEAALEAFKNSKSVFISSRNIKKSIQLAIKYSRNYLNYRELSNFVLINCTPLGMNNEDLLEELNLPLPRKIIDLPYTDNKTLLIEKGIKNNIPFLGGKMFWEWQSEKQLVLFLDEIAK
ncbi:MAG: type I 3-dehydroquinate dehydratase [Candidatus Cloacimonetes bacterium]|nr:type I 3-dehydroquinate dehydratase [Candidatus Cloacimonadota bacterium]